jgi:hypothetical protein
MPSPRYLDGMTSPQLSVRSKRARDLAHELSRREGRPIHAIVEEALTEYARRHPNESAASFLKRMRSVGADDEAGSDSIQQALAEVESAVQDHRKPHRGIDL